MSRDLLMRRLTGSVIAQRPRAGTLRAEPGGSRSVMKLAATATPGKLHDNSQTLPCGEDMHMWGLSSLVLDPTWQTAFPYDSAPTSGTLTDTWEPYRLDANTLTIEKVSTTTTTTDATASADWYDDLSGIWAGSSALTGASGDDAAADWGWRTTDGDAPSDTPWSPASRRSSSISGSNSSSSNTLSALFSEAADDASGIWSGALEGSLVAACDASADWGWGPADSGEATYEALHQPTSITTSRSATPALAAAATLLQPSYRDDLSGIFSGALDGPLVAACDASADWGWQESPELDALPPLVPPQPHPNDCNEAVPGGAASSASPTPMTAHVSLLPSPLGALVSAAAAAAATDSGESLDDDAAAYSDTEDLPQELRHVARAVKLLASASMDECILDQFDALVAQGALPSVLLTPTRFDADLDGLEPASVAAAVAILSNARACRALEDIIMESELPPPRPTAAVPPAVAKRTAGGRDLTSADQAQQQRLLRSCLSGGARMPARASNVLQGSVTREGGSTTEQGSTAAEDWSADEVRAVLDMDPAATRELASFLGALRKGQVAPQ